MAVRIPLVTQPPADGKAYVQKDGGWIAQTGATPTDDGFFTKEDKIALDAIVAGGGTSNTQDVWIAEVAGSNVLLDKDGKAILSQLGEVLHFGDVEGLEPVISRSDAGNGVPHVMEFAHGDWASGAWANNALTIGGMRFYWSTNTINTGHLMYVRDENSSRATSAAATQHVYKYLVAAEVATANELVWPDSPVGFPTLPSITNYYQRVEFLISTRSGLSASWRVTLLCTGSGTLSVDITYVGPRINYR